MPLLIRYICVICVLCASIFNFELSISIGLRLFAPYPFELFESRRPLLVAESVGVFDMKVVAQLGVNLAKRITIIDLCRL